MRAIVAISAEKLPDFFSWQIMRRTKYPGSHCLVIVDDEVFEAIDCGVSRQPLAPFLGSHWIADKVYVEVPCTKEQFEAWFGKLKGIPYSKMQLFGFALPKWTRRFFKNGRKAAICTEFVCWFLTDLMGYEVVDEEFKTPEDVLNQIRTRQGINAFARQFNQDAP